MDLRLRGDHPNHPEEKSPEQKARSSSPNKENKEEDWVSHAKPSQEKSLKRRETQGSTSADSKKPKIEGSPFSFKLDQRSDTSEQVDIKDLRDHEEEVLTPEQIGESYKSLYNKFEQVKPFVTLEMYQECNKLYNDCLKIDVSDVDTGKNDTNLRDQIVELQCKTYDSIMTRNFVSKREYKSLIIWMDNPSEEYCQLIKKIAEMKEAGMLKNFGECYEKFDQLFKREEKKCIEQVFNHIGTRPPANISIDKLMQAEVPLIMDPNLVNAYRELSTAYQDLSESLHVPEVDQEFRNLGKMMPDKIKKQLNERREVGMTQALIERNCQFLYRRPTVEKMQSSELKSDTFDLLMRLKVIEGNADNYYNAVTVTTFPDDKFYHDDDAFYFKIAVDPVTGTLVNHHDDEDEMDKKYREDKFPKNLSDETWPNYLKNNKKLRNEFRTTYLKEFLEHLPEESSNEAWLQSIEGQLATKKGLQSEFLSDLKEFLDPKKGFLLNDPAENSLEAIEEVLGIKGDPWFASTKDMLEIKNIPPQLSETDWGKYTKKLSALKKDLSQESSKEDLLEYNKNLYALLNETWLNHLDSNLIITENTRNRGATKKSILEHFKEAALDPMEKAFFEYREENLKLKENLLKEISKKALSEYLDKNLDLRIKFKKDMALTDIAQADWLKFIKDNNLKYEDLRSKGFFNPLPPSDLMSWLIKEVNKQYQEDSKQDAAPISKIVVSGITHPPSAEILYKLIEPGERKMFTPGDSPDNEFYRILDTRYGQQVLEMMHSHSELFKSQQIHGIELYGAPSGEPCPTFHLDPINPPPPSEVE